MTFDRDYVRIVLNENFEDAKRLLIDPMLAIDEAHLVMLTDTGILSSADARALRAALATIDADRLRTVAYDGTDEDLFFYVERLIRAACDPDIAGRLHTARSRNDIAVTMYRMQLRRMLLTLAHAACDLRASLLGLASEHVQTVFAAHTHTQPAQPTTVAHYLLGAVEALLAQNGRGERGAGRRGR